MTRRIDKQREQDPVGRPVTLVFAIDSLGGGGAQRQVVVLARALSQSPAFRVIIQVYGEADFFHNELEESGVEVFRVPKRHRFDIFYIYRLRNWLKSECVDLVHSFLTWPSFWCALSISSMRRRNRPIHVSGVRNTILDHWNLTRIVEGFTYRHSDHVTVNSESEVSRLQDLCGVPPSRCSYIPNGIDLHKWGRADSHEPVDTGLRKGLHIALIGRFESQKNHSLLLEAIDLLPRSAIEGWQVWFIGDRTIDPAYTHSIGSEIERRGLSEVVKIDGPLTNVPQFILEMDAIVMASKYEGFPNVVLEAMASGVPVLATRVGDIPNMIEDQVSGIICEPGDPEALAQCLLRIEDLGSRGRKDMGRCGRLKAASDFDLRLVSEQYKDLYMDRLHDSLRVRFLANNIIQVTPSLADSPQESVRSGPTQSSKPTHP